MKQLFRFVSEKVLPVSTLFLIFFVPVYPKLPVVDIFGTWVYIRIEDFLVAFLTALYLWTRWYERKFSDSKLAFPIILYWVIGGISVLNSLVFIGPHLQGFYPHLILLHFLRRIEYMMLFFIAYDVFSKRRDLITPVVWTIACALIVIILYGIGQKFAGFPAFLTMNEEFAKGAPLRLPPTARIVSTFGGHYDLAAYLVLLIPIAGSLVIGLKKIWQKIIFFLLTIGSVVLLLFTASRVSFGVYLVGITTMLFWQKKKLLVIPVIIASFILLNFVSSASERFYKTFRYQDVIVDLSTGRPIGTLDKIEGGSAVVEKIASPAEENLPKGSGYIGIAPTSNASENQAINRIIISKDLKTGTGEVATLSGSFLIQKALVYDISITTRFQGEWPKAIDAFKRNILLGSGFSTLSLAVDGNYHRMLGETGILGTIAFLGILVLAYALYFKGRKELTAVDFAFVTGFFAGLTGLLLNAVLIDVFEASKVAFTFWLLMGISMAVLSKTLWQKNYFSFLKSLFSSNFAINLYVLFGTVYLYRGALSGYFLGDDFTWLRWAAQSSWTDIVRNFTDSSGFFYRPIPKLWYFILYSVFWLKPGIYHVISVSLYAVLCLLMYQIFLALNVRRLVALLAVLFFAGLAVHHENVFWISGQSSLLGANFLFLAILLSLKLPSVREFWLRQALAAGIFIAAFLSMLSYDSLIFAPVVVSMLLLNIRAFSNQPFNLVVLFLLPLYWYLRSSANALAPSGDYGYKTSTFLINSLGNTATYTVASFIGPKVIEQVGDARKILKTYLVPMTAVLSALLLAALVYFQKFSRHFKSFSRIYIWLLFMVVSLVPYLGLGGAAERYALVPSAFLLIFLTLSVTQWTKSGVIWGKWAVVLLVVFALAYWNRLEYNRLAMEWNFANSVSEQTLLKLKYGYYPFGDKKTFVFVDTPIRYGRAWIFPTGLSDALWHIFRQAPFTVVQMSDVEAALAYPTYQGHTVVHRFENYTLKLVEVYIPE